MGNDMKKTGVKVKIESRDPIQKENTGEAIVLSQPRKKKTV